MLPEGEPGVGNLYVFICYFQPHIKEFAAAEQEVISVFYYHTDINVIHDVLHSSTQVIRIIEPTYSRCVFPQKVFPMNCVMTTERNMNTVNLYTFHTCFDH